MTDTIEGLRTEAQGMGLEFHPNHGEKTLRKMIDEAKTEAPAETLDRDAMVRRVVALGMDPVDIADNLDAKTLKEMGDAIIAQQQRKNQEGEKDRLGDMYGKTAICRVLKKGDGKISKGVYITGLGDMKYARNDMFEAPLETALKLEERGFVEMEEDA